VLERITLLFPLWTLLAAALALPFPWLFTWLQGPWIVWALAVVMLGMGIELELADFRRVLGRPAPPALGVAAQFLVMPALSALVAVLLRLPPPLAVGLILVGCCPGGTASNVVTLIARADVALSLVMTTLSTLAAVLFTPALTGLFAGRYVPVDGWKLLLDVLQVVLLPVALGLVLKRGMPSVSRRLAPVMPPLAVLAIVLIVASIVGSQRQALWEQGPLLLLAALLLHGGGFLLGWLIPTLFAQSQPVRRTISIEVGMQNSGLAVVLARSGFAASPLTALPGAVSAIVHAVLGSLLASWWRRD
jgi:bile acid:Na+ symporter, BASS family